MTIEEYITNLKMESIKNNDYDKLVDKFGNQEVDTFFENVLNSNNEKLIDIINKIIELSIEETIETNTTEEFFTSNSINTYYNQIKDIKILTREQEYALGKMIIDNKNVLEIPLNNENSILTKKNINKREEIVIDLEKIFTSITNKKDQEEILKILNNYYCNEIWNENNVDKIIKYYIKEYTKLSNDNKVPSIKTLNTKLSNIDNNNTFNNFTENKKVDDIESLKTNLKKYVIYMHARNKMIYHNLRLSFYLAKRYHRSFDIMDTLSSANIGLITAVEKFDYTKKRKFSTHAFWWIRQSIYRYQQDTEYLIRVPIYMHEEIKRVNKFINNYKFSYNQEPSMETISNELEMDIERVKTIFELKQEYLSIASLNNKIGEEEDNEIIDLIKADNKEISEIIINKDLECEVANLLKSLTPREREIIMLRFGIGNNSPMTLEAIGKGYNITRERVRQIEAKAIKKLRSSSNSRKLIGYLKK